MQFPKIKRFYTLINPEPNRLAFLFLVSLRILSKIETKDTIERLTLGLGLNDLAVHPVPVLVGADHLELVPEKKIQIQMYEYVFFLFWGGIQAPCLVLELRW